MSQPHQIVTVPIVHTTVTTFNGKSADDDENSFVTSKLGAAKSDSQRRRERKSWVMQPIGKYWR